jgi:hypothetical protein
VSAQRRDHVVAGFAALLGDQADALFVPDNAEGMSAVGPALASAGVRYQLLSTSAWDDPRALSNRALQGGWYAAPDKSGFNAFAARYRAKYNSDPTRIATLAYDGRRGEMFRNDLFAALEIVDRGLATPDMMKSSWAGALGIIQFTPSSFLRLAVDHDKDGRIDLWSMGPDVIASVANYLHSHGWQQDQTWGRVVSLPPGGEQSLQAPQEAGLTPDAACRSFTTTGAWRSLSDWQELGVRRANGSSLPTRNLQAALLIGDEGDDKGYLVYRNFCSIMRYNPAFRYALSVGLLADAIDDIRD